VRANLRFGASMSRSLLARLLTVCLVLAAAVHGYIVAFHRSFFFRDIDIHRELGRRFLSGEYLYANDYCYMYLPTTGLYFAPLLLLGRNESLALRYMVAIGCLAVTVFCFHRMVYGTNEPKGRSLPLIGVGAVALTSQFILNDLDDGGPHLILLGILTCGIYAIWVGKEWVGAALIGLGIALKITPALFVLLFLWKRQWRVAFYTVLVTIFWIVLPAAYMGPASWWKHQAEWTRNATLSLLDQQMEGRQENEQQKANLSLRHTLMRYLVTYPESHLLRQVDGSYKPVLDLPPRAAMLIVGSVTLGLVGLFAWSSRKPFQGLRDPAWPRDCAGVMILALLLSPITWDQHLVWLMPAALIVAAAARTKGGLSYAGYVMLGVYVLLTMVLNYELLGKVRWEFLKSYHHLGFAMLILFGLLLKNNGPSSELQPSFRNMRPRVPKVIGGR
jgi:alpha-1,2-mannosyltransferase